MVYTDRPPLAAFLSSSKTNPAAISYDTIVSIVMGPFVVVSVNPPPESDAKGQSPQGLAKLK